MSQTQAAVEAKTAMPEGLCSIEEGVAELQAGRMIILVDDEHRENEGDLVIAAEHVTPEAVNFMLTHARGVVCMAMAGEYCDRLGLTLQTSENTSSMGTAFTVTFDARFGAGSGTSAYDRCRTVQVAIDPASQPRDLIRPGHMNGLRAHAGGVLVRAGHTEGSVDLCRLAGLKEAAVICEILRDDGHMARLPELHAFRRQHGLKMCTIEDLIKHRRQREKLVKRELTLTLPTEHGGFQLFAYTSVVDPEPHLALCCGGVGVEHDGVVPVQEEPIFVRIHSQCLTGDIFHSELCDCGAQLHQAMQQIAKAGKGCLLYMRQEGRGIGLLPKLQAYRLQQEVGLDTVEANRQLGFAPDLRHYGIGAQILFDLGIRQIKLLTNNPKKIVGLDGYGLRIVDRVPIQVPATQRNQGYLKTKKEKLGHILDDPATGS
jgi:3,4-dihydroxy 2-butanone 4-phosphate synthase/GTP cyclohydrolase II